MAQEIFEGMIDIIATIDFIRKLSKLELSSQFFSKSSKQRYLILFYVNTFLVFQWCLDVLTSGHLDVWTSDFWTSMSTLMINNISVWMAPSPNGWPLTSKTFQKAPRRVKILKTSENVRKCQKRLKMFKTLKIPVFVKLPPGVQRGCASRLPQPRHGRAAAAALSIWGGLSIQSRR